MSALPRNAEPLVDESCIALAKMFLLDTPMKGDVCEASELAVSIDEKYVRVRVVYLRELIKLAWQMIGPSLSATKN